MGMYIWILIFFTRPHKVVGLDYSLMFKNMYVVYKIWMKTKQFHLDHEQSHIFTEAFTQVKKTRRSARRANINYSLSKLNRKLTLNTCSIGNVFLNVQTGKLVTIQLSFVAKRKFFWSITVIIVCKIDCIVMLFFLNVTSNGSYFMTKNDPLVFVVTGGKISVSNLSILLFIWSCNAYQLTSKYIKTIFFTHDQSEGKK